MSSKTFPTLKVEQGLFASGVKYVIGVDEVGRGALFGPVSVGVAVLSLARHAAVTSSFPTDESGWPAKLADSKLISESVREALYEPVGEWVEAWAVGSSTNVEIDQVGIIASLAQAAKRAIQALPSALRAEISADPSCARMILDGSHNWLAGAIGPVKVTVQTKADRDLVSVAAASVLAKVERDRHMVSLAESNPALAPYGIAGNKGYSSAGHIAALQELGPTELHRKTWLTKILAEDALF